MTVLVPFTLTARLQQGVALDSRFGIALDGLLASAIRDRAKAAAGADVPMSGRDFDGALDIDCPSEHPLPLGRCPGDATPQGWHWLATFGVPVGPGGTPMRQVESHHWTARLDQRQAAVTTRGLPEHVPDHSGRYRTRRMPTVVTPCTALAWRAVGDPDSVLGLLSDIPGIGGGRARGEGTVLDWTAAPTPGGDPDAHGHLDAEGALARPCPMTCADRLGVAYDSGPAGLRPPYFHRARQAVLAVPVSIR